MTPIGRGWTAVLFLLVPVLATAAETPKNNYQNEAAQIPIKPSAPTPLPSGAPSDTFRCTRFFKWKGKLYECDSFVRQDAEKLRSIVSDVPAAVSEIDQYQATRTNLRTAAYLGTAGVVLGIVGLIAANRLDNPVFMRYLAITAGAGLSAGSFVYAVGAIQTNEGRLGTAIQHYNSARPATPIELQFSTGFNF